MYIYIYTIYLYVHAYTYVFISLIDKLNGNWKIDYGDLIRTSICDNYLGAINTIQLDHISNCEATPGTNRSNRRNTRVFMMNTRRD